MTTAAELGFDDLKRLRDREGRAELGYFLAEDLALELGRALTHRPALAASRILVSHEYLGRGLPAGFPSQLPRDVFNARQMAPLSDTRSPQGVIAVVPILPSPSPVAGERAVYLHEIQDPGNLGTRWRGSAASVACSRRTASTRTTPRWCAPAWARSSACRSRPRSRSRPCGSATRRSR
jgi:tRNA G18 (ribose-2'-O)-methylase SpoU